MIKQTSYIFILVIMAFSCGRPEQEPEFLRIDNIRVSKVTGTKALLNADAYFYNPNDVRMKLTEVDIDVEVEGKRVGKINQTLKTRIPAKEEFKVPLDATFNMGEIGLLNSLISVLNGNKVKVHYSGFIKVRMYGFTSKVPVDFDDEVRI